MPTPEKTTKPPLRLVESAEFRCGGAIGRFVVGLEPQAPMLRRPGDHLEVLELGDEVPLAEIRMAAARRGMRGETAVALVLERGLASEDLRGFGLGELVEVLDARGSKARANIDLWSAHSSYLRHLLGLTLSAAEERPTKSPRVALPVRLIDRLGAEAPRLAGDLESELEAAVKWEIAALAAGMTIGEWAYRSALAALTA